DVEQQQCEGHHTCRTVNAAIGTQTKTENVGQEAKMRTGQERDHVGQRQVPSSETSFRQCGNPEAETEDVESDVDQLDEDAAPSPRT
ncbi:MAG: hypothetical protein Q9161_009829, partial [Pseudevernia consocians]